MNASGERRRPPSVTALARSLAGSGLPHAIWSTSPARRSTPTTSSPHPRRRRSGARCSPRWSTPPGCCCTPTSDGRRWRSQDGRRRPSSSTSRPATAVSRQRAVGQLFARLCGAEAAMVVNNNAAAVLLVLAALAERPRGAGEPRRERRDRRRLPGARGDGAVGRAARRRRHHQPHPPRRLPPGARPDRGRRGARAQGAPEQLPRRRLRRGDAGRRAGHARRARGRRHRQRPDRRDLPVAAGSAAGVACRRARRPADPRRRRRAGDVQRRQAARRTAGRHHRRPRRPRRTLRRHPLARALRPGGLVLAALQETALAYLDKRAATDVPFWRMVAVPIPSLRARRADAIAAAVGTPYPSIVGRPDRAHFRAPARRRGDDAVVRRRSRRRSPRRAACPRPPDHRPVARRSHDARPAIGRPAHDATVASPHSPRQRPAS